MPPKLTDEEKKAARAEKRAERKVKQIERKKQLKRDQLYRELKYSSLTYKRHEKDWRQMLINIALPAMRDNLEFAWHNFERVIDCKDFTISLLMDELREAEEQYMMNHKNHIENIDKLIDFFHERVEELQDDNDRQISVMRQRFEEEIENEKDNCNENETYVKTILYILEVARKSQNQNVRAEYFSKLEEEETKNSQVTQRIKDMLDGKQYIIQTEIQEFLDNYHNQVRDRKKQHDLLKTHDEVLQKLLFNQLEKIRHAQEDIKRLRQKLGDSQKILGTKLRDLESEQQFFNAAFSTLKKKLVEDRKVDEIKINTLTVNYHDTLKVLEKLKEKGEQILHVSAVCRKLETLEEKILPFPIVIMKDIIKATIENVSGYEPSLQFFWQRVGQADASRYAVNEEREFLKTENEILKMKLHRYCQCLKCPALKNSVVVRSKNITEGVLEMKKYELQDNDQFGSSKSTISDED
ncbi:hypothetical protein JTB14_014834 [Gonioctena quinquepunctata]|nr:hypothetical protein JTB14_014834 [Gonioctena quinquepunctata]